LRNRPEKQQLLIYDSFYPSNNNSTADIFAKMMSSSSSPTASPESYPPMPFHHKEILNIAEELYDQLLKIVVNNTIYIRSLTQQISNPISSNQKINCENKIL
jgi:hypothetical protein